MAYRIVLIISLILGSFSCSGYKSSPVGGNEKLALEEQLSFKIPVGESKKIDFSAVDSFATTMSRINSLLIIQNDTLLFEKYYNGFAEGEYSNLKSSSKSILNLLIGIAIEEGYINNIDETLYQYVPEIFSENMNREKKDITIKHLMTMTSGLESTSLKSYSAWTNSDNWLKYAIELPLKASPGSLYEYSTGDTHLLSAILTNATGMSSLEFAQQYLYGPMEIEVTRWDTDPQGVNEGGNNVYLKPYDLAKIGIMVSNGGKYRNKRIVPQEWIAYSIGYQVQPQGISRPFEIEGYGYLWWLVKAKEYQTYSAIGYGGQYMMIIPELDITIVLTSLSKGITPSDHFSDIANLVENYILGALEE